MERLAKKEYVHNTGNKQMYYNSYSRKLIARTFSNFDVHFKTKLDFLTLSENYPTCTSLSKYVFQGTAYTWIISAISKHYASSLYKRYKYIIPPAKLLISTILDTITNEEMTAVFEYFVENGSYKNKEFEINGQKVLLTTSQIAAVSLVYSLNNKIRISKEIGYTIPEKAFIIVDADGSKTKTCIEKEKRKEMLQALRTDTQHKRKISKISKISKTAKPVVGEKAVVDEKITVDEKSTVSTNAPKHAMKIDVIRNNIEKFACCVSAADEQDFKKTSDIIIAIMAAGAVSGDDTKNHDVADAVIKTSLKGKQHLVNMFEIIING
jgi:hypothetical protein